MCSESAFIFPGQLLDIVLHLLKKHGKSKRKRYVRTVEGSVFGQVVSFILRPQSCCARTVLWAAFRRSKNSRSVASVLCSHHAVQDVLDGLLQDYDDSGYDSDQERVKVTQQYGGGPAVSPPEKKASPGGSGSTTAPSSSSGQPRIAAMASSFAATGRADDRLVRIATQLLGQFVGVFRFLFVCFHVFFPSILC